MCFQGKAHSKFFIPHYTLYYQCRGLKATAIDWVYSLEIRLNFASKIRLKSWVKTHKTAYLTGIQRLYP